MTSMGGGWRVTRLSDDAGRREITGPPDLEIRLILEHDWHSVFDRVQVIPISKTLLFQGYLVLSVHSDSIGLWSLDPFPRLRVLSDDHLGTPPWVDLPSTYT